MSTPDSDPSIKHEPHLSARPARPDSTECRADDTLSRERPGDAFEERARHSAFDEPDILPGRPPETIEVDWPCSACGYNLRGLRTGTRCPECNHLELYRPPPDAAPSLQALRRRSLTTGAEMRAMPPVICASVGVLAGLFGGLLAAIPSWTSALLTSPAAGEFLKLLPLALLVEARPQWFASAGGAGDRFVGSVRFAAVVGALAFALVQNVIALVMPGVSFLPGLWTPIGRFTACVAMHLVCTVIAAGPWQKAWQRTMADARRVESAPIIRAMILAMGLHSAFNAACVVSGLVSLVI